VVAARDCDVRDPALPAGGPRDEPVGSGRRWGLTHGKRATQADGVAGGPERRLMLAVLLDAVHRRRCRRSGPREGQAGLGWQVEDAWLRSEDRSWPFAFASICDALGLESTYLRRCLLRDVGDRRAGPARRVGRG